VKRKEDLFMFLLLMRKGTWKKHRRKMKVGIYFRRGKYKKLRRVDTRDRGRYIVVFVGGFWGRNWGYFLFSSNCALWPQVIRQILLKH